GTAAAGPGAARGRRRTRSLRPGADAVGVWLWWRSRRRLVLSAGVGAGSLADAVVPQDAGRLRHPARVHVGDPEDALVVQRKMPDLPAAVRLRMEHQRGGV